MRKYGALLALLAFSFTLTACGDDGNGGGDGRYATVTPVEGQKRGGTLRVLSAESFQDLDPGTSYFQLDYEVVYAVHRPLYSYKPDDFKQPVPDLARSQPKVSANGRRVTVDIRPGVRFSKPVDRNVTSKDVKYAIERGYNPSVANGYAPAYFSVIRGAEKAKGGPIAGIKTPSDTRIVFELSAPHGANLAKALVMPLTAPVPKEYAEPLDAKSKSVYETDPTRQAFTGPYVIADYQPAKRLVMERNPAWNGKRTGDHRPAYLNRIEWSLGADPNVAGRQVLSGRGMVIGDVPAAPIVKQGATKRPDQISFTPIGNRYVSINTTLKPFDDVNVRRAVNAIMDRRAMQLTRGGRIAGDIATHILPPTIPGYEEAGGAEGPGFDFLAKPEGDPEVAAKYLRKAGFANGRYEGPPIVMIADTEAPADKTGQVVLNSVRKLGFRVDYRAVSHDAFLSKFCNVKKALEKIHICTNYGWLPDFNDPVTMVDPTFNGQNIVPVNNSNPSLLDDPKINRAIDEAKDVADPKERARRFGEVDRMITGTAATVPWFWDKQPNVQAKDVQGVIAQWNASYDFSYTSLK